MAVERGISTLLTGPRATCETYSYEKTKNLKNVSKQTINHGKQVEREYQSGIPIVLASCIWLDSRFR